MAAIPSRSCGLCKQPLNEAVAGDTNTDAVNIVKTHCGHMAHEHCFINAEQLQRITRVNARIFCFDEGCQNRHLPYSLYYGDKNTWRQKIVEKGKVEVISIPKHETNDDSAPDQASEQVTQQRADELKRRDLRPVVYTFGLSVVSITAICAFAAFQTITATFLAIALGSLAVHFSRRVVENYLLALGQKT